MPRPDKRPDNRPGNGPNNRPDNGPGNRPGNGPGRRPRTTLTARTPADLVAAVPQLLGFHPHDSVVLMTFGTAGECFHARVDLPAEGDAQLAVAEMLTDVVTRHGVRRVALLAYTDDPWLAAGFHDVAVATFVGQGVHVVDVLRVGRDRVHRACEPDDPGQAYDLRSHPFTAEQVVRGRVVHASRAELAATLDPVDAAAVASAAARHRDRPGDLGAVVADERLVAEHAAECLWVHQVLRRHIDLGTPLPDDDAGRLLALIASDALRDVAWAQMERDDADRQVELWRDLVRRSPRALVPQAASLLAFAAWLDGDGALAWCALDRVVEVDPDHPMAGFVAALLERAVPPSSWALVDDRPEAS